MIIIHKPSLGSAADNPCLDRHVLQNIAEDIPPETIWIDLLEPTREEERKVEEMLGIEVPTRADMQDLEPSELLYVENGARYMTARVLCRSESETPKLTAIAFILTDRTLVTVRYDEPRSFQVFVNRASKPGGCGHQPEAVLEGLMEAVVDRAAEILRKVSDDINETSREVFESEASASERGDSFRGVIRRLGRQEALIANVRESMVSLERVFLFLSTNMQRPKRAAGFQPEWRTAVRDTQSIEEHANFLSSKAQFILDATFGLVTIEQNKIIKIFSVMAVIFMPPTLVGTIYGMNFKAMPELEWAYGYPMALTLMVLSAIIPYNFFRWKKWL